MSAGPPMLAVQDLLFGHHGRPLGDTVSLDVRQGEVVALLGPNGCGKTTLFRTVLGLLGALGGQVRVGDAICVGPGVRIDRAAMARRVAYVPQAHAGAFAYAVHDVVLMGRASHVGSVSMPSTADRALALDLLGRLGIAHLAERSYLEISGGERQLVLIARALAQQAPVLVMDEPTASLDFGNQRIVLREIEALKARGVAVLLSTHQPEHALAVADRALLLGNGRVQALGATRRVLTPRALAELYGMPQAEVERSVPGIIDAAAQTPDLPDWAAHYRSHMRRQGVMHKPATAWDARASDYARSSGKGRYAEDFLARVDLAGARSVLDVGCGPGTLAVPLAQRVGEVVALDYSSGMLQALGQACAAAGVGNVRPLHRAWEDDWSDVPVCDIAIASRSTTIPDLDAAIGKLCRHARLRVYLSCLADGYFVAPRLVRALGVEVPRAPEPLVVLGMLFARGLQPRLDYLETPSRLAGCADFDEFARRVAWSTGPFDAHARQRLKDWFDADPQRARQGGASMRWAFIHWAVQSPPEIALKPC